MPPREKTNTLKGQGAKGEGKVEKNLVRRKCVGKKEATKYMSLKKNLAHLTSSFFVLTFHAMKMC